MSQESLQRYRRLLQMRALQQKIAEGALSRAENQLRLAEREAEDANELADAAATAALIEGEVTLDEFIDSRMNAEFFAAGASRAASALVAHELTRDKQRGHLRSAAVATRQMETVVDVVTHAARAEEGRKERIFVDETAARARARGRKK